MEPVAPAASFGSWDAEVRQEGPEAPSNQRLTLIALCFFRDQFQLAKFWTYASMATSFCPLCSCVMTLVDLALTKMLAVHIVGCASGFLTLPWDQRSGRHQQAGKAFQVSLLRTFSRTYLPVATSSSINGYQAIGDLLETSILISPRPSTRGFAFAEALMDHSAFMIVSAYSPVARSVPEGELNNRGSL